MAFQDDHHTPQEMAFQLPQHHHISASPSTGPTWLSNAVLRRHDDVLTQTRIEKPESNTNNGSEEELIDSVSDNWERAKCKAEILGHPLYEQLLAAHVACLRIATPVDQLARIDTQLAQSQDVVAKYSGVGRSHVVDEKELDQFMVITTVSLNALLIICRSVLFKACSDEWINGNFDASRALVMTVKASLQTHYVLLLCSFKDQLQQHVRVHAMEAVMACWELEQSLQGLTGVSPGEGTGATMSDDDDDQADSDANLYDGNLDGLDTMGFGPLVPTETERSLMERVRQELKHELKQDYKEKIVDIREEILRKRRAGKLPGDTTSLLKAWWQTHSKWPYPTVIPALNISYKWNAIISLCSYLGKSIRAHSGGIAMSKNSVRVVGMFCLDIPVLLILESSA
ncbi:hypothetical protein POTOM_023698 [Populus tomentosa]|uniref:ELK domain-containing protein n=1 Tax=Populus tomentosa TaxID=118781 RepID=A0A8X8CZN2_POPTO|nr:hypothetical protein POTOM_023698 [Populus tomentosa]